MRPTRFMGPSDAGIGSCVVLIGLERFGSV